MTTYIKRELIRSLDQEVDGIDRKASDVINRPFFTKVHFYFYFYLIFFCIYSMGNMSHHVTEGVTRSHQRSHHTSFGWECGIVGI